MSLQAYLEASPRGLAPSYSLPSGEDTISCDICGGERDVVIELGSLWACGGCWDEMKASWNPGRGR